MLSHHPTIQLINQLLGGGFCFFADIPLAIKTILAENPHFTILIIDLDAHQGNGHETICGTDDELKERVSIFDVYNAHIYPHEQGAKRFITYDFPRETPASMQDEGYLELLRQELTHALDEVKPNLII